MTSETSGESDQDWRLKADLEVADTRRSLHGLVGRFRGPQIAKEVKTSVPHDVVITHDGQLLFVYATDETNLAAARTAIENVLCHDGINVRFYTSHWDDDIDDWHQTDPPATAQQQRADDAARRDAEAIETRTLVASSGKLIRAEFEQTMRNWANKLGVKCEIIEHPHLLTTQVGFTVTGPKRKVDEFSQGLTAEERATMRVDTGVMLSPL